jgi:hypothetical protein
MATERDFHSFSDRYGKLRELRAAVRETADPVREEVVQCIWYDQIFDAHSLRTDTGVAIKVVSPGWWNHSEGPDFKSAQIEFNGKLRAGDIEIHLDHGAWKQHGHHLDPRYDDVMLVAVLDTQPPATPPLTSKGRRIPVLLLANYIRDDIQTLATQVNVDAYPFDAAATPGRCNAMLDSFGSDRMEHLLNLAGDWRILAKAKHLEERSRRAGISQALYEGVMTACGFSRFKYQFRVLAEQLPYERARQLVRQDSLLLEAALLHLAGLLPVELPDNGTVSHHQRLLALKSEHLAGLRGLPLRWRLLGVRPTNYPERRLAGAARMIAKTAADGLGETIAGIWLEDTKPTVRRKSFDALFPVPMGFWADHCTWTGKPLPRAASAIGKGRVLSILGNVFVPAGLMLARQRRDRALEERVLAFFASLPQEPENRILKIMLPRIFAENKPPKLTFRLQQGLIQMHYDWCEPNPSCRNCNVLRMLDAPK